MPCLLPSNPTPTTGSPARAARIINRPPQNRESHRSCGEAHRCRVRRLDDHRPHRTDAGQRTTRHTNDGKTIAVDPIESNCYATIARERMLADRQMTIRRASCEDAP
jgi:hypothetical protein